jgi:UDP-N-acetylglucosamine 3-dehydrogenase
MIHIRIENMLDKIKVGVIGTGVMAEIYASIIKNRIDCELVAVVGNSKIKTDDFSNKFNIFGYDKGEYQELYRNHPEIDTTIISTPEWVREAPVKAAVENNQNIILEKPFANNLQEAEILKKILVDHKNVVEVCHVLRYSPRFCAMKRAVEDGKIGDIRHIYARRNSNTDRVQRVLGKTDLAFWLSPHDIDIMRWITQSDASEVFARSRNNLKLHDDYLIANIRFENGVDAVLENSWCSPNISGSAPEAVFEVWGTKGSILLSDYDMNIKVFQEGGKVLTPDTYEDYEIYNYRSGFFESMMNNFIRKIKSRSVNNASIKDGFETVRTCKMIRDSIEASKVIFR